MRTYAYIFSIVLFVVAITLGVAACGTIINGTQEEVTIMAQPADAVITVDGKYQKTGFLRWDFDRRASHRIEVSKAGYVTQRIQTGNSVSGWYFANLSIFSVFGMVPDLISGGAFTISPNPIVVELTPGTGSPITEVHNLNGYLEAGIPTAILTAFLVWFIVEASKSNQTFP